MTEGNLEFRGTKAEEVSMDFIDVVLTSTYSPIY